MQGNLTKSLHKFFFVSILIYDNLLRLAMLGLFFGVLFAANVHFDFQGGGVKGLGSATVFTEVAKRLKNLITAEPNLGKVTVLDMVNSFSGVSAGSIQATLLAYTKAFSTEPTSKSLDDVLKMMTEYAVIQTQIQERACCGCFFGLCGNQFDPEPLIEWLVKQFGQKTLGDLKAKGVKLEVLGHNMTVDSPILFSTEDNKHKDLKLWQVVMASAAFPTGFPAQTITIEGKEIIVCDGGISAKDLSLHAVGNAVKKDIVALFGTGDSLVETSNAKKLQHAGKLGWLLAKSGDIISRLIDGNTEYSLEKIIALAQRDEVKFFPFQYDTHGQTLDTSDENLNLIKNEVNTFLATTETKKQIDELAQALVANYKAKLAAKTS